MTLWSLCLIIAAALFHAIWNLITKQVNGRLPFFWLVCFFSAVIYLPFVSYQLTKEPVAYTYSIILFAVVSGLLHLLYFVVLQAGYRNADLSIVYPIARGAGPLFSVSGAILIFHEHPGVLALAGVALIIAGVIIMTGISFKRGTAVSKGLLYGTLTGVFIASYTLWDKTAVVDYHVSGVFITFASVVLPMLLLIHIPIKQHQAVIATAKNNWKQAIAVAVFQPLAYWLVLLALKTTPVTYVAPARELSIVFGVFFGMNVLKEKDSTKRLLGSLVILGGIALLAIG
ncbi:Uncharacterized membrane protein [Filimonas lacunae]|uniref:Uncharacterized membrane protein n=1 Tax=Filimonas lacunae TaxID=477680 RepID=A0A173MP61_9BACT|nr:DMT family transporter [Filimonas lacunae]BAV09422.1 integral membrane protein [Filimonas lacunae]SIS72871.1 Uncharacterized membrane protein [Filimonas lacunae]